MSLPRPVRVVGLGSASGDDALGWEVVDRLKTMVQPGTGVELHRIESGQRLLDLLDGKGSLVVIDAVRAGGPVGRIYRRTWPGTGLEGLRPVSTHGVGLAEVLALAATLGLLPAQVIIHGMEAGETTSESGLSPTVAMALPRLVEQLVGELAD